MISNQTIKPKVTSAANLSEFQTTALHGQLLCDRHLASWIVPLPSISPRDVLGPEKTALVEAAKPLLTFGEAAQFTGISEKLLRVAAKTGDLKARKIGRALRMQQADLSAWIDGQFN